MKRPDITFSAAGDMLIQRVIPTDYEGFDEVSSYIKKGDARFFNLETTVHRGRHPGNQFCGGSYLRVASEALNIAREFGFNMLSFANNHTFDFGYGGLKDTLEAVNGTGFVNAGVGMNLDEAVVPYFEMADGELTHLEFMPVALGIEEPRYRSGNPRFAPDRGIIERLAEMSAPYGTTITINEQGIGVVKL